MIWHIVHYAVLAFYSILKDLEQKGIAPLLNYHLINFSQDSISSGWCSYSEITKVKQTIFDYQGLGTKLDPMTLSNLRLERKDNFILFSPRTIF